MTLTTGNIFKLLDRLEDANRCRMYRVTMGDGSVSRVAAFSLRDVRSRVLELRPGAIILGIDEVPTGARS